MTQAQKQILLKTIEELPPDTLDEVVDFVEFVKARCKKEDDWGPHDAMLLSEAALAREWLTPEEDEAWAPFQKET